MRTQYGVGIYVVRVVRTARHVVGGYEHFVEARLGGYNGEEFVVGAKHGRVGLLDIGIYGVFKDTWGG